MSASRGGASSTIAHRLEYSWRGQTGARGHGIPEQVDQIRERPGKRRKGPHHGARASSLAIPDQHADAADHHRGSFDRAGHGAAKEGAIGRAGPGESGAGRGAGTAGPVGRSPGPWGAGRNETPDPTRLERIPGSTGRRDRPVERHAVRNLPCACRWPWFTSTANCITRSPSAAEAG